MINIKTVEIDGIRYFKESDVIELIEEKGEVVHKVFEINEKYGKQ